MFFHDFLGGRTLHEECIFVSEWNMQKKSTEMKLGSF